MLVFVFFSSLFVNYSIKIKLIESALSKNKLVNIKVENKGDCAWLLYCLLLK